MTSNTREIRVPKSYTLLYHRKWGRTEEWTPPSLCKWETTRRNREKGTARKKVNEGKGSAAPAMQTRTADTESESIRTADTDSSNRRHRPQHLKSQNREAGMLNEDEVRKLISPQKRNQEEKQVEDRAKYLSNSRKTPNTQGLRGIHPAWMVANED